MTIIESSMKGMIKEHKKTGTKKKLDRRKERNLDFLSPVKKILLLSLFHRKETDT